MTDISQEHFKNVVENIFNRWTALKITVEHGSGGKSGHQTAIEIMNYITRFCLENNGVGYYEIKDALEEIMDQEFNTICDDGSIDEVSNYLVKYLNMCKENRFDEINADFSKMPPCQNWLVPGAKINYKPVEDSSSDEEEEDDEGEAMDQDDGDIVEPSSSGSTTQMIEEDLDPGWTVVNTKNKRKNYCNNK